MGRLAVDVEEDTEAGFEGLFGSGMGLLGGDQVTRYGADVSILSLSVFSDASPNILGLADKLSALGFLASISKISRGYVYTSFHIVLSKPGLKPFAINDAKAALAAGVAQQSLSLSQITDALADTVVFAAQAIPTAVSAKGQQQTQDALTAARQAVTGTACSAIKGATGLSCTVWITGAVVVGGLYFAWPFLAPVIASKIASRRAVAGLGRHRGRR
jgi:hypothetical protein